MVRNTKTGLILHEVKHKLMLYFALFIALSLNGCIRDNESTCELIYGIEIKPVIAQGRIIGNDFSTGDKIGLYVTASPGFPANDNFAANVPYTFDGSQWTTSDGSLLPWPGASDIDVYAYSPYDPNLSSGNPRIYNFSIKTDQTSQDKYLANDLLWARATDASPGAVIPLRFSHLMARMQINIRSSFDAGPNWPTGAEVHVTGLSHNMIIDLNNGNIVSGISIPIQQPLVDEPDTDQPPRVLSAAAIINNEKIPREETDLFPLILNSPVEGYDISMAAIIKPQDIQAGTALIRITLDGKEYSFIPNENLSFIPGENFTLNLVLTDHPSGPVLDLDQIDWSESRVWNVYNGSEIVAQVCREYLQGTSKPDVQAVVVYPASQTGVDFSSGFAARIYQANKNSSGDYDINLQNIHGGSVDFNASTLYSQGMLPPVRKVIVEPGVGIFGSFDTDPTSLTVKATTVSDYDSNLYPVVKINKWYWTASNLRTLHFTNGNSITALPYNGDAANTPVYGLLYTGYSASEPQNLLPLPWRVPYEEDYESMITYLQPSAGSKIKANVLWTSPDYSNDVTGFRMLPGGFRNGRGVYSQIGTDAYWWTDTESGFEITYFTISAGAVNANSFPISYDQAMSVRLVLKDSSALTK